MEQFEILAYKDDIMSVGKQLDIRYYDGVTTKRKVVVYEDLTAPQKAIYDAFVELGKTI